MARELDALLLPADVVLGYRSAAPIMELKLTGPALQRLAMEQIWQQIRAVAGENTLFEGTRGLPALLAQHLTKRGLTVAISEQFSAGLVNWQLQTAQAPLSGGELIAMHCEESLALLTIRAQLLSARHCADLVLAIGALQQEHLSIVLHTPNGIFGQTIGYQASQQDSLIRQETSGMLALDMLRRRLTSYPVYGRYSGFEIVEKLP